MSCNYEGREYEEVCSSLIARGSSCDPIYTSDWYDNNILYKHINPVKPIVVSFAASSNNVIYTGVQ